MEVNVLVRFECKSAEYRERITEFLMQYSRPEFDDDVEPEYQELFSLLEVIEFPASLEHVGDKTVHAYFTSGWPEVVKVLAQANVERLFACVQADEYVQIVRGEWGKLISVIEPDPDNIVLISSSEGDVSLEQADAEAVFAYLDALSEQCPVSKA